MESYKLFEERKRDYQGAMSILNLIGKPQRASAKNVVGTLHNISVGVTIHHQEYDGATNYHEEKALNTALSTAAREMWEALEARAKQILETDMKTALAKAEGELQTALKAAQNARREISVSDREENSNVSD